MFNNNNNNSYLCPVLHTVQYEVCESVLLTVLNGKFVRICVHWLFCVGVVSVICSLAIMILKSIESLCYLATVKTKYKSLSVCFLIVAE